jgi:uncharacterized protein YjiS (DUF1127 family)
MKHPMIFAIAGLNSFTSRKEASASSHHDGAETCRPGWVTRFFNWWVRCSERSRQRQALAELDDHHLKDIGKTRPEAMAEAASPFGNDAVHRALAAGDVHASSGNSRLSLVESGTTWICAEDHRAA